MSGKAVIVVTGTFAFDPDMSYTPGGLALTKVKIAEEIYSYNPQKKIKEPQTRWWNISCFGKNGENLASFGWKNTVATFSGSFECRMYTARDGTVQQSYDMNANSCDFISKFGKNDPNVDQSIVKSLGEYDPTSDPDSPEYTSAF